MYYQTQLQKAEKLGALTPLGVHKINRGSIEKGYIEVPEDTVRVLSADSGPTGKIVFVYWPKQRLPRDRSFFADYHTRKDVEKLKILKPAQAWISEFLWATG
ncbi:hypothetical protein MYX82_02705 [Acidobacteria bacterium AH-259-D05]|nr:hypothetical protein [Acidobacteria bacterium AH-259-D05]